MEERSVPPSQPPTHHSILVSIVTSVIVCTVVLIGLPGVRMEWLDFLVPHISPGTVSTTSRMLVPSSALHEEDAETVGVVKRVEQSVVAVVINADVNTLPASSDPFGGPGFPSMTPPPANGSSTPDIQQVGGGSGFFVSNDGIIATNRHVVEHPDYGEAPTFEVVMADGRRLPATVLAADPLLDLAFLKVDATGTPALPIGDSTKLVPGQTVIAIGNALGEFQNTVTKGVVSGLNRTFIAGDYSDTEVIEEAIQTDAAINPGNSGGPLLDLDGMVVGMNTAVSDQGQSIGFALPSTAILRDLQSLDRTGRIVRPFLGVRYVLVTPDVVKSEKLKVDHGALIVSGSTKDTPAITVDSPAATAGLKEGDVILSVDGTDVNDAHSLAGLIGAHAPGDEITLSYDRDGTTQTATTTLVELKK